MAIVIIRVFIRARPLKMYAIAFTQFKSVWRKVVFRPWESLYDISPLTPDVQGVDCITVVGEISVPRPDGEGVTPILERSNIVT